MPEKRLQIAVARLGAIGDVLLTTPLLEAIRSAHPECRITYIVGEGAAQALDYSPFINELIIWPDRKADTRSDLQMIRKIAGKRFDIAINLTQSAKLNLAFWLGRVRIRLGFAPVPLQWMVSQTVDVDSLPKDQHRTLYFLEMARRLNIALPANVRMNYTVTPRERDEARMILEQWKVDPSHNKVIAIHPGTSTVWREKRRWAVENFVEVARHAGSHPGWKVVILGGPEERALIPKFSAANIPGLVDLTERLSFREFAAVLSQCHVLVHNDSAPLHLACALGVPVVAIFGYQNHHMWGPIGPRDRVVRMDLPCSPCASDFACDRTFECLRTLKPDVVIAALDAMLQNT